ncbi:hypothetical protein CCS79_12485 [Clostridium diolis]|uniref:glycosyltransferase family 2 protein n=1 Tax=Clostridium diolis TaxID=223919 RepID=UPI000B404CEE|nr:glycosyltransferase [Clostridium diolis]OVE67767.1 hypothetical protein CCS79_12485 [Clostridium diolis]
MDLISVVITTYNRPIKVIKRALDSVLQQSYKNIEVFLVNDSPLNIELSNSIEKWIESYKDDRIKYIIHEKNMGACQARNTGAERANGMYIAFLDDDDEWLPNKLSKQIQCMSNSQIGLVYCSSFIVRENGIKKLHVPKNVSHDFEKEILCDNFVGSTSFPLLRLKAFKECGMFDTKLVSCQDYDMWIRILKKYKAILVEEPLCNYYLSNDSVFKKNSSKYMDGDLYILEKYHNDFEKYQDSYLYHLNNMALNALLMNHDCKMYFLYKAKAISYKPFNKYNYMLFFIKGIKKANKLVGRIKSNTD